MGHCHRYSVQLFELWSHWYPIQIPASCAAVCWRLPAVSRGRCGFAQWPHLCSGRVWWRFTPWLRRSLQHQNRLLDHCSQYDDSSVLCRSHRSPRATLRHRRVRKSSIAVAIVLKGFYLIQRSHMIWILVGFWVIVPSFHVDYEVKPVSIHYRYSHSINAFWRNGLSSLLTAFCPSDNTRNPFTLCGETQVENVALKKTTFEHSGFDWASECIFTEIMGFVPDFTQHRAAGVQKECPIAPCIQCAH